MSCDIANARFAEYKRRMTHDERYAKEQIDRFSWLEDHWHELGREALAAYADVVTQHMMLNVDRTNPQRERFVASAIANAATFGLTMAATPGMNAGAVANFALLTVHHHEAMDTWNATFEPMFNILNWRGFE